MATIFDAIAPAIDPATYERMRTQALFPVSDPSFAITNALADLGIPAFNPIVAATAPAIGGGLTDAFLIDQAMSGEPLDTSVTSSEALQKYMEDSLSGASSDPYSLIGGALHTMMSPDFASALRQPYYDAMAASGSGASGTGTSGDSGDSSSSSSGDNGQSGWEADRDSYMAEFFPGQDRHSVADSMGMTDEQFDQSFRDNNPPDSERSGITLDSGAITGNSAGTTKPLPTSTSSAPGTMSLTPSTKPNPSNLIPSVNSSAAMGMPSGLPTGTSGVMQPYSPPSGVPSTTGIGAAVAAPGTNTSYASIADQQAAKTSAATAGGDTAAKQQQTTQQQTTDTKTQLPGVAPSGQPGGIFFGTPDALNPYLGSLLPVLTDSNALTSLLTGLLTPLVGPTLAQGQRDLMSLGSLYAMRTMPVTGDFFSSIWGL